MSVGSAKMATMKASERAKRDAQVMGLFYAGVSYRGIAQAVGLKSKSTVGQIVERELGDAAERRELIGDQARAVWQERFERLFRANWGRALDGDRYAASECRRLLGQFAQIFGLSRQATVADTGRLEVEDVEPPEHDQDVDAMDELARLRYNRAAGLPPQAGFGAS